MKNTTLLILLSLFIMSCGDKTREEILERFDNGQKKLLVIYKGEGSGEEIFERITYDESGHEIIIEKPLKKIKIVRTYYKDGQFETEKKYKNKLRHGKSIRYYKDGQIESELDYKHGKNDGKSIWYYENGQIWFEENYKDGKLDGEFFEYYKNGQKFEDGYCIDEVLYVKNRWDNNGRLIVKDGNGKGTYYHENGQLSWEVDYKNGLMVGKFISYNEDGQIDEERDYKNGKRDGKSIWYYPNGHKKQEEDYKNGMKHGEKILYYESGLVRKVEYYWDDELLEIK